MRDSKTKVGAVNRQRIEAEFMIGGMSRFFKAEIE